MKRISNLKGAYSIEHEELMKSIAKNNKIELNYIDENTIIEINKYLREMKHMDREVLEESITKRINDIELDLSSYIGHIIGIASINVTIIPVFLKYIKNDIAINIFNCIEIIFTFIIVYLLIKIQRFYFKRKKEVLFYKFLLNRINKFNGNVNKKNK